MPISERQLEANRANALKSTGPKSAEGKKKSSQNARRHGVTAKTTVMTDEDRVKYDSFCATMIADFAPVGAMETFLASSAAEEAWRLDYSRAHCINIIAMGHFDGTGDEFNSDHAQINSALTSAITVREHAKTLELLSLYEQRIHRSFQKHYDQLRQLQAERKAKLDQDMENARLLSQLADLKDLPYDPADDGFSFSNVDIDRYTDLYHRLRLAKQESGTWKTKHSNLCELPKLPKAA